MLRRKVKKCGKRSEIYTEWEERRMNILLQSKRNGKIRNSQKRPDFMGDKDEKSNYLWDL